MKKFTTAEVKELLKINREIVHLAHVFMGRVITPDLPENRKQIQSTLQRAEKKFPDELKDEEFYTLVNILKAALHS